MYHKGLPSVGRGYTKHLPLPQGLKDVAGLMDGICPLSVSHTCLTMTYNNNNNNKNEENKINDTEPDMVLNVLHLIFFHIILVTIL